MILIQLIITILLYFIIQAFSYYYTEKINPKLPFLQFPPFYCDKCLSFWLGLFVTTSVFLLSDCQWLIYLIMSIILIILTAISKIIEEKKGVRI